MRQEQHVRTVMLNVERMKKSACVKARTTKSTAHQAMEEHALQVRGLPFY